MMKGKTTLIQKDSQQIQAENVSTDDVENPHCTDWGGDLFVVDKPRTVS